MSRSPEPVSGNESGEAGHQRRQNFRRELIGIFIGVSLAMMIGALLPTVRENVSLGVVILWGGAIGGIFSSIHRFEKAGAALTKKENRALNLAIGLGIPLAVLVLIYLLGR